MKGPAFYGDDNEFALMSASGISMDYPENYTSDESANSTIIHLAFSASTTIRYLDTTGASSK